jgi:hypothetical protein
MPLSSRRLCRCEPPPSPIAFPRDECVSGRRAQPTVQRAARSWPAPSLASPASAASPGDPGHSLRRCAPHRTAWLARAGRRRFAPPAVGLSRAGHPSMPCRQGQRSPCSRQFFAEVLGWTPSRPPAGRPRVAVWCLQAGCFGKLFRSKARDSSPFDHKLQCCLRALLSVPSSLSTQ